MNEFASIQSSSGLLKDSYGRTGMDEALKRKREKLAETRLGLDSEDKEEE